MFRDRDGWRVQWTGPGGRRSKKFETKTEARVFEARMKAGEILDPLGSSQTFAEFSRRWIEEYCKVEKAPSALLADESALKCHILPVFGGKRLSAITRRHVQDFRVELRGKRLKRAGRPLSTKSVNHILALLKKMLATAEDWELLQKNPGKLVKLFPLDERAADYWTSDERERFWLLARHKNLELAKAAMLACHTGLRRSELAALERQQLDFDRRLILVNAMYCYKTTQRLRRTKNRAIGWLPMNDFVYRELLEFKNAAATARVIADPKLLLHASRDLRVLCEKIGMRPVRWHELRHTFGSAMASAGVDRYVRQKLMRQKTAQMTDRYSHLEPEYLAQGVAAITRSSAREEEKSAAN